jgi:hypothetical protein
MLKFQISAVSEGRVVLHRAMELVRSVSDGEMVFTEFISYVVRMSSESSRVQWVVQCGVARGPMFVARSVGRSPEVFVQVLTSGMEQWLDRPQLTIKQELLRALKSSGSIGKEWSNLMFKVVGVEELISVQQADGVDVFVPTRELLTPEPVSDRFFSPFGR